MLIIRPVQMKAFSILLKDRFENRMTDHLRSRFPARFADFGDEAIRKFVRGGISKARQYELTGESEVCRYLEFMVVLSPDFDNHPGTAWAGHILRDKRLDGTAKIVRLDRTHLSKARR